MTSWVGSGTGEALDFGDSLCSRPSLEICKKEVYKRVVNRSYFFFLGLDKISQ